MSEKFAKKWVGPETTWGERIKGIVRPQPPLRPRIEMAIGRLQMLVRSLDQLNHRLISRDKDLFNRVVNSYQEHRLEEAKVYASELAELRKLEKTVLYSKLALEQAALRLETVKEMGDVTAKLGPVVAVIKSVKSGISSILPEAGLELSTIGDMLSETVMEASYATGIPVNLDYMDQDAESILKEAAAMAEVKLREKLPDLPKLPSEASSSPSREAKTSSNVAKWEEWLLQGTKPDKKQSFEK